MPGGQKVVIRQVVEPADFATIENRFKAWAAEPGFAGLLVDFDHESSDTSKSTRAGAWINNIERRADGAELWAQLRLTSSGQAALAGGDFRHFSPVLGFPPRTYNAGEEAHPIALLGGAFTNQPTFRGMLPLSNRQGDPATTQPAIRTMNKELVIALLAALGQSVAADAAPEAIDAALKAATTAAKSSKEEMAATTNRLKQLEAEQIQRDLDAAGLQGDARKTAEGFLTKNRAEGLAFIAALGKDGSGYARTHNRAGADTPDANAAKGAEQAAADFEAKVTAYKTSNRCTYQQAHAAVKAAEPALYAKTLG